MGPGWVRGGDSSQAPAMCAAHSPGSSWGLLMGSSRNNRENTLNRGMKEFPGHSTSFLLSCRGDRCPPSESAYSFSPEQRKPAQRASCVPQV